MPTNEDKFADLAGCLALLVGFVPMLMLDAWLTKTLWNWFAVPFFVLRPMTLSWAIAVGLLVSRFKHSPSQKKDSENLMEYTIRIYGTALGQWAIMFLVAAIVKHWFLAPLPALPR